MPLIRRSTRKRPRALPHARRGAAPWPRLLALCWLALGAAAYAADAPIETWTEGLDQPWSLAFLPDGGALVTERRGTLRRIGPDGRASAPLAGVPPVYFAGQGGLFDVVPHPGFADNRLVFLSFAEGRPADNGTAVARGRLGADGLEDTVVVFRNYSRKDTAVHYGGRLAFLPDGSLLLTTGDGFDYREAAQDLSSGLGKVLRMTADGAPAPGNPFPDAPYVYSYGHRNPQGLAVAADGTVWLHEHGPKGGDEVNRIEPGANYGWPAITHGVDYSGALISPYTEWPGMAQPAWHWTPSIAPSGLAIGSGDAFPQWRGDLLVGALVAREVRRLELEDGRVVREEPLFPELGARVRDLRFGHGGALYVLLPDRIVRIGGVPARR
jgi:glucose/arabinose dehydrogenase